MMGFRRSSLSDITPMTTELIIEKRKFKVKKYVFSSLIHMQ